MTGSRHQENFIKMYGLPNTVAGREVMAMCGLTGFVHSSHGEHRKPELERVIEKMTSTLASPWTRQQRVFL